MRLVALLLFVCSCAPSDVTPSVAGLVWEAPTCGEVHQINPIDPADDAFIWAIVDAAPGVAQTAIELGVSPHDKPGNLWIGREASGAWTCRNGGKGYSGEARDGKIFVSCFHHIAGRFLNVAGYPQAWYRSDGNSRLLGANPNVSIGQAIDGTQHVIGQVYAAGVLDRHPSESELRDLYWYAQTVHGVRMPTVDADPLAPSVIVSQVQYPNRTWWTYPIARNGPTIASPFDLIRVKTQAQIDAARASLWTAMDLDPQTLAPPDTITVGDTSHQWGTSPGVVYAGLASVDRLDFVTIYGMQMWAYVLRPTTPNGKLVMYHHGHGSSIGYHDAFDARITHSWLLREGYTVLACAMPMAGPQVGPPAYPWGYMTGHAHFYSADIRYRAGIETPAPWRLFVEAQLRALAYLRSEFPTQHAMGLSGGAWTVNLLAAMDTQIRRSVLVSGSFPMYTRTRNPALLGDDEQGAMESLYDIASYLDLYVLGSSGDRSQVLVTSPLDLGVPGPLDSWSGHVQAAIDEVGAGGAYRVVHDLTVRDHAVSPLVLREALASFEAP